MKQKDIIGKPSTALKWKRVLREIYEFAPNLWGSSNKMHHYDSRHFLAKKLKMNGTDFGNTIAFLEDQKLISSMPSNNSVSWILTEKGFNVALENEKAENTESLQIVASLAAAIIALISILNFLYKEVPNPDFGQGILFTILIISLVASGISLIVTIFPIINKSTTKKFN